jgi:hypothetical protein
LIGNIDWETLDIKGKYKIRDLWQKKNVGKTNKNFKAEIEPHGVFFLRLIKDY